MGDLTIVPPPTLIVEGIAYALENVIPIWLGVFEDTTGRVFLPH